MSLFAMSSKAAAAAYLKTTGGADTETSTPDASSAVAPDACQPSSAPSGTPTPSSQDKD